MQTEFAVVLNMSAAGSAVILAVLLARLALRRVPKMWSYLLWSVAGFRLACPVSLSAAFSAFSGLRERTFLQNPGGRISVMEILPLSVGGGSSSAPGSDWTGPAASVEAVATRLPDPVTIAAWIWLAGIIALLLYGVISYWRTWRTLHTAFRLEGNLWQSEAVRSPFILGVVRPRIYIPLGLEGEELRYVLAHERYHLRHGDHLVRLFAFLLLAVHWFNPLCWLAYALCGRDMEMRCDEAVLDSLEGIRKSYSRTLLSFAEGRRFPRPLAFGEASVRSRIQNALRWKRPRTWVTALAAALCAAVIAACGVNPALGEETSPGGETVTDGIMDATGGAGMGDTSAQMDFSENKLDRLKAFPNSYAEIMERTDLVIYTPDDRLVNGQLWENFWNSVQKGQSADVILAYFTVEGDLILQSISYDGNLFHYYCDMSRDQFGGNEKYLRDDYRFLQRLETNSTVRFILTDEEFPNYYSWREKAEEDYAENEKHPRIVLSVLTKQGNEPDLANNPPPETPNPMSTSDVWGITLAAKDATSTGLTLVCTQSGGTYKGELLTGEDYVLERKSDGEILAAYAKVPYAADGDIVWADIGISVPLNDTREFTVDWSRLYGELPPGQYRIGKRFFDVAEPGEYEERMIYARFTIPDGSAV